MIDLGEMVMDEALPYTLITRAPGMDIGHDWQDGEATSSTIQAVIWPATAKDAVLLPEGTQINATIGILTTSLLDTDNTQTGLSAARIVYGPSTYEVMKSEPWDIGGFYRSYATRLGQ